MAVPARDTLPSHYERLHVGIGLYDPATGTLLDANERLESLFGYSTAALQDRSLETYSANTYGDVCEQLLPRFRAAGDGEPQRFKWRVKRSDGTLIWVQADLSEITVGSTRRVLAEIRDITEYTTTSRRVGLLSRIMRHNLRNDLTVIMGRAQQIDADTDCVLRHTEKIRETAVAIDRMTESVREIERATTQPSRHTSVRSAAGLVRETVADLREEFQHATIDVEERTEMWFRVDESFTQALTHAVENGVDHADDPTPSVTVVVDESPNTGRVEIRIRDECPPIPDVEIDALDAPGENTTTAHGTGVGLFVMKWSIESLGGEMSFDREGGGNVVSFYLPPAAPGEDGP